MDELARRRIAEDQDRVAFLYVDGHVREYHGKFPLFEAKKAQRQVVTPAATDTWVHDADGEPLLVVTSEVNAKLTQVLEPILADVRRLVGDQRRMTVIFDRGGFSPKLFARLIAAGFDVITYRKGKVQKLPAERFATQRQKIDGVWREYQVCDRPRVRVGALPAERKGKGKRAKARKRYLWMREVRVLRDDGRQTSILTNRQDLSAVMVRLPHVSSLASGELLQVRGGRVCPGRAGRIRGGGPAGSDRPPQSPMAPAHAAAERGPRGSGASAKRIGKRSHGQRRGDPTDDAWIQDRACRTPPATPEGRGARSSGCWNSVPRRPSGFRPTT